jgi:hypothetical protein
VTRLPTGGVDLSAKAIAARARARERTGSDGGYTARQLIERSDLVFARAKRLAKVAGRTPGRRGEKASAKADDALRTANLQLRIAQATPLDKGYLHHLSLERIQILTDEVVALFKEDEGATLAVDTHRRLQDQRMRLKAEGGPR